MLIANPQFLFLDTARPGEAALFQYWRCFYFLTAIQSVQFYYSENNHGGLGIASEPDVAGARSSSLQYRVRLYWQYFYSLHMYWELSETKGNLSYFFSYFSLYRRLCSPGGFAHIRLSIQTHTGHPSGTNPSTMKAGIIENDTDRSRISSFRLLSETVCDWGCRTTGRLRGCFVSLSIYIISLPYRTCCYHSLKTWNFIMGCIDMHYTIGWRELDTLLCYYFAVIDAGRPGNLDKQVSFSSYFSALPAFGDGKSYEVRNLNIWCG